MDVKWVERMDALMVARMADCSAVHLVDEKVVT